MEEREISQRKRRVYPAIAGSIFIVPGVLMILFWGQTTTLVCQRTKSGVDCRIEADFMGIRMRRTEIPHLRGAEVQLSSGRKVDPENGSPYGGNYRVMLITESGNRIPMIETYTGGFDDKQEAVDRIDAFIANRSGQPSLQIQRSGWRGWMWGGAMLLIGVLLWKSVKANIGEEKRAFGRIGR